MKKAQISIELIVLVGFVLLIFVTMLSVFSNRAQHIASDNQNKISESLRDIIFKEMILAKKASAGYTRNFNIPVDLAGERYTAEIEDNVMFVLDYGGKTRVYKMPEGTKGVLNLNYSGNLGKYSMKIQKTADWVIIMPNMSCQYDYLICDGAQYNTTNQTGTNCAVLDALPQYPDFNSSCCGCYKRCC